MPIKTRFEFKLLSVLSLLHLGDGRFMHKVRMILV
jgi:hypothetical protein